MCQTHKWTFSSILRLYKTSLLHSQETILSHTSVSVCANSCLASCSTTSSWFFLVHFSFFCRKILWHNEPSMHPINAMVSCTWVFYLKLSWKSFSRAFIFWHPEFLDKVRQSLSFNHLKSFWYLENKGLFFLTAINAPDIAKGSPTTLSSQWGSFLDSYFRPTWSATKTSRLLFIKIKQKDVTFVMLFSLCILCFIFQNELFSSNFIPSLENQQPRTELPCLGELK